MKRHLLRFAWLYAILLFLLCIPAVVWTLLYVPPIDPSTQLAVARWLDEENERRYGPSIGPEFLEAYEKWESVYDGLTTPDQGCGQLMCYFDQWTPLIDTQLELIWARYGPMIEAIDQVWSRGVFTYPNLDALQSRQGGRWEKQLNHYEVKTYFEEARMKLYCLRFQRALHQKNWTEAQKILDSCLGSISNRQCHWHFCEIVDAFYQDCLNNEIPVELTRKAMLSLRQMRIKSLSLLNSQDHLQGAWRVEGPYVRCCLRVIVEDPREALALHRSTLNDVDNFVRIVAKGHAQFEDPAMQRWAARMEQKYDAGNSMISSLAISLVPFLRAAARDPGWQKNSGLPLELWETCDPWTMMLVSAKARDNERFRSMLCNKRLQVQEWMLEAALSAQVYYGQQARWPTRVQDLDLDVSAQPPAWGDHPLQIQWIDLNEELRNTLWNQMLMAPIAKKVNSSFRKKIQRPLTQNEEHRWAIDVTGSARKWGEDLGMNSVQGVQAWLMSQAEAWAAHPGLVCSAQVMGADLPSTPSTIEQEEPDPFQCGFDAERSQIKPGWIGWEKGMMGLPEMSEMPGMGMHGRGMLEIPKRGTPKMPKRGMPGKHSFREGPYDKDFVTTPDLTLAWTPLDAEQVRTDLNNFYDDAWPPAASEDAAGTAPAFVPPRLPGLLRLRAELTAPAQALVIWHPGPDGVDDGGQIVYDPTNGTVSGGDMVIFPQHF